MMRPSTKAEWWEAAQACFVIAILVFAILTIIFGVKVYAHDPNGTYTEWMMKQRNMEGWQCCDGEDAILLDDDQGGISGSYKVAYNGKDYSIPDWMLVDSKVGGPNITNHAVLWLFHGQPQCFTPSNEY